MVQWTNNYPERKMPKSKDMIIAKISKTIKNLMSKKTQVIPRDAQMNSNPPGKDPPV